MEAAIFAIRTEAAVCELDGPRMTGPITSLKILGGILFMTIVELIQISSL
jgi:hypothetical protein